MSNGKMPDMGALMKQAQKLQADMQKAQEEVAKLTCEASAGGGMVTAVVSGTGDLKKVTISPDVVDPDDVEMLEDLVVAAVVEAMRMAQEKAAERMGGLTAGLDLGGLGGLLG